MYSTTNLNTKIVTSSFKMNLFVYRILMLQSVFGVIVDNTHCHRTINVWPITWSYGMSLKTWISSWSAFVRNNGDQNDRYSSIVLKHMTLSFIWAGRTFYEDNAGQHVSMSMYCTDLPSNRKWYTATLICIFYVSLTTRKHVSNDCRTTGHHCTPVTIDDDLWDLVKAS